MRAAYVSRGVSEKYIHFSDGRFYIRWKGCTDKVESCPLASGGLRIEFGNIYSSGHTFNQDAKGTGTAFCNHLFLMLKLLVVNYPHGMSPGI